MAKDAESTTPEPAPKRFPKKLLGIVLGIAIVQAAGFFAVSKLTSGHATPAKAESGHAIEADRGNKGSTALAEVPLLKSFKVPNEKTGRMFIYDLDLSIVVPAEQKEKLAKLAEERGGEIADRVAAIVRAAGDAVLREDDLSALRAQLAEALAEIFDDPQMVRRVLIPRLVPIPT